MSNICVTASLQLTFQDSLLQFSVSHSNINCLKKWVHHVMEGECKLCSAEKVLIRNAGTPLPS
jgi:hypothetical protein